MLYDIRWDVAVRTASGLHRMPECIYTCWRYLHRNNTDKLCHGWRYRIMHLSSIIAEAIVSNKNFDNEVATTSMLDWFVFRTSLERQIFKVNPDWWTNRHVHMLFGRFFVFMTKFISVVSMEITPAGINTFRHSVQTTSCQNEAYMCSHSW
jgi:hypothetical protein